MLFLVELANSVSISSRFLFRRHSGNDSEKIMLTFLFVYFIIVTGDGNTNYIVLFIVSRFSAIIQLSISGFFVVMEKPIKNAYLGIVKHDWTSIVY